MDKKPFQFKDNKPTPPPPEPDKQLRVLAIHQLEGMPPYEPIESMMMEYPQLKQQRFFRGLTKREYAVIEIFKVLANIHGSLLPSDADVKSMVRTALVLSEGIFQTLAGVREEDIKTMMNQIISKQNAQGMAKELIEQKDEDAGQTP